MTLDDFFERIEIENAARSGTHALHPPLTDAELQDWRDLRPATRLPGDLLDLLRRSNGLGLYQDWYDGEPIYDQGAIVIFPLREIGRADEAMYGRNVDDSRIPDTRMAFVLGPDSTIFYGFDTETLHFWTLEPIVPDESEDLGPQIGPLLDILVG